MLYAKLSHKFEVIHSGDKKIVPFHNVLLHRIFGSLSTVIHLDLFFSLYSHEELVAIICYKFNYYIIINDCKFKYLFIYDCMSSYNDVLPTTISNNTIMMISAHETDLKFKNSLRMTWIKACTV